MQIKVVQPIDFEIVWENFDSSKNNKVLEIIWEFSFWLEANLKELKNNEFLTVHVPSFSSKALKLPQF